MATFMGMLDLFGKKDVSADLGRDVPFTISTSFVPYKLKSNQRNSTSLYIEVKNMTKEPVLASVVVDVPNRISLDDMGLTKQKELRVGTLGPSEMKRLMVNVACDSGTNAGEYTLSVTAFIHYRDYAHIINSEKKKTILQVV